MGGDCRRPIAAQFPGDLFGLKNCQRTWEKYRLALYFACPPKEGPKTGFF